MRQGEVASQGKWTGDLSGGVKAPPALILPDPVTRFARTAARLEALAAGHPMTEWLAFMARLTRGPARRRDDAATIPRPSAKYRGARGGRTPLAAAWREGLTILLDTFDSRASPPPARAAVSDLRARDADAVEALASRFLLRGVDRCLHNLGRSSLVHVRGCVASGNASGPARATSRSSKQSMKARSAG
jgi:FdhE protein